METTLATLISVLGEEHEMVTQHRACLEKARAKASRHAILKDVSQISAAQLALSAHSGKQVDDFNSILKTEEHNVILITHFLEQQKKYVEDLNAAQAKYHSLITGCAEQLEILKGRAEALKTTPSQTQTQPQQDLKNVGTQLQPQLLTTLTASLHTFLDKVVAELPMERRQTVAQNLKDELTGVMDPLLANDALRAAPPTPMPVVPGQEPQATPPQGYGKAQLEASALREAREAAEPYTAAETATPVTALGDTA